LAIRAALNVPGSVDGFVPGKRPPASVPLWLHPEPPMSTARPRQAGSAAPPKPAGKPAASDREGRKRRAERVDMPDAKSPFMLMFRAESLFSWAEFIKADRPLDEDENEDAEKAANDLDYLSIAEGETTAASRIRFDLDLPAEADDDLMLIDGILLPEWDYRKQRLQPDHCRL
jgi:nitric oxide reductase NorD protein